MSEQVVKRRTFKKLWSRPGYLIRRLHQIHVAMFLDECAEFKLTPVQFAVLTVLDSDGVLDQISVAKQISADRNTVGDVLRRLESRGLIERPASENDRRAKLAQITEKGRSFVESVLPSMIKVQRDLTSVLTREENAVLTDLLVKLIKANKEASRSPKSKDISFDL